MRGLISTIRGSMQRQIAGLLLVVLLAPWAAAISFFPQRASAQTPAGPDTAFCLSSLIQGKATGVSSIGLQAADVPAVDKYLHIASGGIQGATESATIHDCVIKPIIILIAKTLLAQLTRSIVNWINNGFQGNPAFVTDLQGFLTNVADQVIGEFIYGSELSFLCSPFQLQVRVALALNFQPYQNKARCTLSSVVGNVNSAFTNFAAGGWPAWFAMTTNPQNNPYGSYLMAQSELSVRIASAQYTNTKLLEFGRGFFSFKQCSSQSPITTYSDGTSGTGGTFTTYYPGQDPYKTDPKANCTIVTPGAAIQDQLSKVLGTDIDQLELANDINSIISALVGQLIKQGLLALGGVKGLSTQNGQFGGGTALDVYVANAQSAEISGRQSAGLSLVDVSIAKAQQYISVKQATLNQVLIADSDFGSLIDCYRNKIASSSLSSTDLATAQRSILAASTTQASLVTTKKVALSAQIAKTQGAINQAYQLESQIQNATSPDELDAASAQFTALTSSGALPSDADIATAQQEQSDMLAEINPLIQDALQRLDACYAFPQQQTI